MGQLTGGRRFSFGKAGQYLYSTQPWGGAAALYSISSGASGGWGAYVETNAGMNYPLAIFGLQLRNRNAAGVAMQWSAGLGVGAAGAETQLMEIRGPISHNGEFWVGLNAPIFVPPNTRMALRVASSSGSYSGFEIGVGWMIEPEFRVE